MKKKGLIILAAIVVVIVIVVGTIVGSYNGLVDKQTAVSEKSATIQAQLQRRSDLIPNFVATVKSYSNYEESIYTKITDARAALSGAKSLEEQATANVQLTSALNNLIALAEDNPELQAIQSYTALQDTIAGTENRISTARIDYNKVAAEYNASIRKFPKNIFAGMFGFEKVDLFEAEAGATENPDVGSLLED